MFQKDEKASIVPAQFQPSRHLVQRLATALSVAGFAGCVIAGNPEFVEVGSVATQCPIKLEVHQPFAFRMVGK